MMIKGWVVIGTTDQKGNLIGRDEYISFCHKNNRVMIVTEDQGAYWVKGIFSLLQNKTDGILCDIDFPNPPDTVYGSCILAMKMPYDQGYECISIRDDNNTYTLSEEDMIRILQTSNVGSSHAGIDVRGGNGIIDMFVGSDQADGGQIKLAAKNNSNTGQISIKTDIMDVLLSTLKITSLDVLNWVIKDLSKDDKITTFTYQKGVGLNFSDEFGNVIKQNGDSLDISHVKKTTVTADDILLTNQNGDVTEITSSSFDIKHKTKVNIGDGANHPAVFGDALKSMLTTFFDSLNTTYSALTVPVVSVGSPSGIPVNIVQMQSLITQAKADLNNILSQYLFVK